MVVANGFIPLQYKRLEAAEQQKGLDFFHQFIDARRSVRHFSKETVNQQVLERIIHTAGTAPSGANQQPWTYVLVRDAEVKKQIRIAAEQEERELLKKATIDQTAKPSFFGEKSYIEDASHLIVLFRQNYGMALQEDGTQKKVKHYYSHESAPISAGFLLAALQHAGIDSLVHAPSKALKELLHRPKNETAIMVIAVGYRANSYVPQEFPRKPLQEILIHGKPAESTFKSIFLNKNKKFDETQQTELAEAYYQFMKTRRNIRDFSTEDVDISLIYQAIEAAATAPSGGNMQPYRYAVISDLQSKQEIRDLAEMEEKKLYEERISDDWREALAPLGTNWRKQHLTDAPHLIIAFKVEETTEEAPVLDQSLLYKKNSFAMESAAISVGLLMNALHHAGLWTLTHTPSPMYFLRDFLNRPKNEIPFLVLPVGYPAKDCQVPNISKKPLSDILIKV